MLPAEDGRRRRPPAGPALRIVEKVLTGERSCSAGLALTASALALISSGYARLIGSAGSGAWLVGVGALVPVAPSFTQGGLPLVEPLDCLVGGAVVAALLQVQVARFGAERPVGVDDPVALPVLLDPADSLPPGALALDRGG